MMACFIAPMILAVIMTTIQKSSRKLSEKLKLWILNVLLWGGVILLALEHAWHGEITPWPPFLTAMTNPMEIPVMLHEVATIGVAMTSVTVAVWALILVVSQRLYVSGALVQRISGRKPLARLGSKHL